MRGVMPYCLTSCFIYRTRGNPQDGWEEEPNMHSLIYFTFKMKVRYPGGSNMCNTPSKQGFALAKHSFNKAFGINQNNPTWVP